MGNITRYKIGSKDIFYSYNSAKQLARTYGGHNANFQYDDRGNVTFNGRNTFSYNLAGQMTTAGSNTSYLYDSDNRRVKKTVANKTTFSMYSASGKLMWRFADGQHVNYYYLNNQLIARKKGSTTTYLLT